MMANEYQYDPNQKLYGTKFGDLGDFNWAYRWNTGDNNDITNRFAVTFNTNKGNYTFVPEEVINKGFTTVGTKQQHFFNSFLDPEFQKEFGQSAQAVDLKGVIDPTSWAYINNKRPETLEQANPGSSEYGYGWSGKGYLVPEATFNEWNNEKLLNSKSYELGKTVGNVSTGAIQGMALKDGKYVYVPEASGASGASAYIPSDGKTYTGWLEKQGGFGGFLGEMLGDIGGFVRDLGPIAPFALNFVVPGLGTAVAAGMALGSGNELAGLAALAGLPGASNAIGAGAASALQAAGQVSNLEKALESGNLLGALTSGASLAGAGGTQIGDTGVTVGEALKTANIVNALEQGNVAPLAAALGQQAQASTGPKASEFEPGSFGPIEGNINPSEYGLVDLNQPLSGDYTVQANYELFPQTKPQSLESMGGAQGVKAPALPDVFAPSGEIDYSLFAPTKTGGEPGLQIPTSPNLDFMGGGQGLGGTTGEYTPPLGDVESFINQPAPTSGVDIEALQKKWADESAAQSDALKQQLAAQAAAAAKASAAQQAQNAILQKQMAQQSQNQDLMNMLMMAGLSGQQQPQQPVQVAPADVKSFEEQGYGQLFGGQLKFSEGGNIDDLLNILRG